jgi:hypothetical protein
MLKMKKRIDFKAAKIINILKLNMFNYHYLGMRIASEKRKFKVKNQK